MLSVYICYMLLRFLSLCVVILLVDFYFFQSVKTLTANWQPRNKTVAAYVYWGITVLAVGLLLIAAFTNPNGHGRGFQKYIFNIFLIITLAKSIGILPMIIEDIVRLFRWIFSYTGEHKNDPGAHKISRARFVSWTAVGMAAVPFASLVWGMVKTAFDYSVKNITVTLPNLPQEFDGFKIVQISDLHTGSLPGTKPYERAVELANAQNPDVIFMTGDLVNNIADEALDFIDTLKNLKSPNGVFSILGNHDYGDYVQWETSALKEANLDKLKGIHAQMGWKLMLNENALITRGDQSIAIIGIENWGNKLHFPRYGKMDLAYKGIEDAPVKLLLSHDPSHWEGEVIPKYPDIDVTFSGHTHGFQFGIEIPGVKWSPSQYIYKQWGGLYKEGSQYIYVNRGLGFLGYLGRVGIPPEITVMTLKRG